MQLCRFGDGGNEGLPCAHRGAERQDAHNVCVRPPSECALMTLAGRSLWRQRHGTRARAPLCITQQVARGGGRRASYPEQLAWQCCGRCVVALAARGPLGALRRAMCWLHVRVEVLVAEGDAHPRSIGTSLPAPLRVVGGCAGQARHGWPPL